VKTPTFIKCPDCGNKDFFRYEHNRVTIAIEDHGGLLDDHLNTCHDPEYQCDKCDTFIDGTELGKQAEAHLKKLIKAKEVKPAKWTREEVNAIRDQEQDQELTLAQEEQVHEHRQGQT